MDGTFFTLLVLEGRGTQCGVSHVDWRRDEGGGGVVAVVVLVVLVVVGGGGGVGGGVVGGVWGGGGGGGSRCFYPPPPRACLPACLSVCPAPAGEEAPPPGSQQPAASLLLSPALCSAPLCCARLRPGGLARCRSFLRDNNNKKKKTKKREKVQSLCFSTEGWTRVFSAERTRGGRGGGGDFYSFTNPWISPFLFAVSRNVPFVS